MQTEETKKAFALAYKFLKIRQLSEEELKQKLSQKDISNSVTAEVVSTLKEQKLIDDKKFACEIFERKGANTPKELNAAKAALIKKGVNKDIIDAVYEGFLSRISVEKNARELGRKKSEQLKRLSKKNIFQKTGAYLFREGFEEELILEVLEELDIKEEREFD